MFALIRQRTVGLRKIDGNRPPVAEVSSSAQRQRAVIGGKLRSAVQRKAMRQPPHQGRLAETHLSFLADSTAIGRRGGGIFHPPLALQNRYGGIGYAITGDATVGLLDLNVEIAAGGGRIEIVDGECARRYIALVDGVAVLTYRHLSVAFGDAVDSRREAFHAVRQHIVVRRQL